MAGDGPKRETAQNGMQRLDATLSMVTAMPLVCRDHADREVQQNEWWEEEKRKKGVSRAMTAKHSEYNLREKKRNELREQKRQAPERPGRSFPVCSC